MTTEISRSLVDQWRNCLALDRETVSTIKKGVEVPTCIPSELTPSNKSPLGKPVLLCHLKKKIKMQRQINAITYINAQLIKYQETLAFKTLSKIWKKFWLKRLLFRLKNFVWNNLPNEEKKIKIVLFICWLWSVAHPSTHSKRYQNRRHKKPSRNKQIIP